MISSVHLCPTTAKARARGSSSLTILTLLGITCYLQVSGVVLAEKRKKGNQMTLVQDRPIVATNSATVKQWLVAMAKGDFDHAPYAEDAEISDPSGKYKGKQQILASFKAWKTAFPQANADVTNQVAEGDQVVSEVTFRGTHTGPLASAMGPIAATNKPIELKSAIVSWFRNGLIQRERVYFDLAGLMQQLGLAPTKP